MTKGRVRRIAGFRAEEEPQLAPLRSGTPGQAGWQIILEATIEGMNRRLHHKRQGADLLSPLSSEQLTFPCQVKDGMNEAPPSPLSSRAKPRDLQFSQRASDSHRSAALPFVIPSEAEGSAVLSTSIRFAPKRRPPLCHPERSRGICGSLNQHPIRTEAPPSPLSSRAKSRDLQFFPLVPTSAHSVYT
jgi:hypothetical protein